MSIRESKANSRAHRYTTSQLAELWQVSERQVMRHVTAGRLVPIDLGCQGKRLLRFTETEVRRFEESRTTQPRKSPRSKPQYIPQIV